MSLSLMRAWLSLRRTVRCPYGMLPVLLLALVTCCASTRADSPFHVVTGSPHSRLFQRIYSSLSAVWKSTRRIEVHEVSAPEMERLVAHNEDADQRAGDDAVVDGCYQSGTDDENTVATITLCESLPVHDMELVFTHEYGHYVWDEILTDAEQKQYRALWKAIRRTGRFVTRYASEMDEEGFAESFAYYVRKPSILKRRDPRSFAFIERIANSR